MTYKKLTPEQRAIKHWRDKRNALVGKLRSQENLSCNQALEKANALMRKNRNSRNNSG